MYQDNQDQARLSQEDQESIDSFDLDFLATDHSPTSLNENQDVLTFKNKIKNHVPDEENLENVVERKHGCQICFKRFRTKWHLTEHMIVHTGIYPFQCVSCKRGFKRRKALESHPCMYDNYEQEDTRVTESNQGFSYTCPHCMEEFTSKTAHLRHSCSLEDSFIFKQKKVDPEEEDSNRVIIFQEPHGEAVEIDNDVKSIRKATTDFYKDTLRMEDGIDAIADLTGLSIQEVSDTLTYFCKKVDSAEDHYKEATETLKISEVSI